MGATVLTQDVQTAPGLGYRTGDRARASATGVAWSFVNAGLSVGLTALVFLVTSRVLTPTEFGTVALAVSIVALIGTAIPTAFGEALVQRPNLKKSHLDSIFWLTVGVALGLAAGLSLAASWIAEATEAELLQHILPVLALRLIFDAVMTVPGALITRRMEFRYIALRTTLANGVGTVLCLAMIAAGYAIWALIAAQLITSIAACLFSVLAAKWRPGLSFSLSALGDLRHFGLYAMGGRILNEAKLDQLLLGLMLGPATLGLYFFARRLFQMLRDLTTGAFASVTNVLMASLQSETERQKAYYLAACFASASLSFPVFAGLFAIAPTAVPYLFGSQWTEAIFSLRCFSIVGLMAGLGVMQAGLIRYLGAPGWWFWYQTLTQLLTLPLIVLLAPFGLNTIMVAIVLKTAVFWPASVLKAQTMLNLPLGAYLGSLAAPAVAAGLMALAVHAVPEFAGLSGSGSVLALQLGVGAGVYGSLLAVLGRGQIRALIRLYRSEQEAVA